MGLSLRLLTLLCFLIYSDALPDGAPTSACSSLLPVHSAIRAQSIRAPYTVSAVKRGDKVKVTISSNGNADFRGFMLQARSGSDRSRYIDGQFTESEETKTIDCFKKRKNTLTQVDRNPKREIVTEWTPDGSVNDDVVFRATVVKSYKDFWTEVDSQSIKIRGSDGSSSPSELNSNRGDPMYDNCFRSKGCFGYPSGCASSRDCEVLLTYSQTDDGIQFALHSVLDSGMYMAMGLSEDASMGDDSVTECYTDGSNVIARESWNQGKRNINTNRLQIYDYQSSYSNGLATCNWTKPFSSESNGRRYNFRDKNYYILLAKGQMNGESLGYHRADRLPSGVAVDFTAFTAVAGAKVHDAIKIHGTFMVTAWVGFVSMAILLARHFKNTWENSTLGGVKIWFALHRAFMVIALMFFVIAFIVIFVHQNGWNYQTSNPHAILGCIAVALGIFNPIMALFRPGPDHKNRPVFNWLHFIVGKSAHIIAIITIFFAVSLPSSGLTKSFYWVMGIFVIVHLIFHLLYQVHSWSQLKKKNNDVGMNEMNGSRTNGHTAQSAQAKNVSDNVFRILLLGIYCIFLLIILIALYSLIGVA